MTKKWYAPPAIIGSIDIVEMVTEISTFVIGMGLRKATFKKLDPPARLGADTRRRRGQRLAGSLVIGFALAVLGLVLALALIVVCYSKP